MKSPSREQSGRERERKERWSGFTPGLTPRRAPPTALPIGPAVYSLPGIGCQRALPAPSLTGRSAA